MLFSNIQNWNQNDGTFPCDHIILKAKGSKSLWGISRHDLNVHMLMFFFAWRPHASVPVKQQHFENQWLPRSICLYLSLSILLALIYHTPSDLTTFCSLEVYVRVCSHVLFCRSVWCAASLVCSFGFSVDFSLCPFFHNVCTIALLFVTALMPMVWYCLRSSAVGVRPIHILTL